MSARQNSISVNFSEIFLHFSNSPSFTLSLCIYAVLCCMCQKLIFIPKPMIAKYTHAQKQEERSDREEDSTNRKSIKFKMQTDNYCCYCCSQMESESNREEKKNAEIVFFCWCCVALHFILISKLQILTKLLMPRTISCMCIKCACSSLHNSKTYIFMFNWEQPNQKYRSNERMSARADACV